jgi:hypothetical protein
VPDDFVRTHHGFFHPSCVVVLRPDEVWSADLVVRGKDGGEREHVTACPFPRYALTGALLPHGDPVPVHAPSFAPRGGGNRVYDSWILDYYYAGRLPVGSSLSTDWLVPLLPNKLADQDIAFFNGVQNDSFILQPILDLGELVGQWAIESEHCCPGNNDIQSTLVAVNPGDHIRGTVTAANCAANGICSDWTVTTADLTTGDATVLNMQSPGGVANALDSAVLETYNITSCDMLPANGEITFFDNKALTASGAALPLHFVLDKIAAMAPQGFPLDCGYRALSTGDRFTLYFGISPAPVDAGVSDAAAMTSDAASPRDAGERRDAAGGAVGGNATGGAVGAGGARDEDGPAGTSDAGAAHQAQGSGCTLSRDRPSEKALPMLLAASVLLLGRVTARSRKGIRPEEFRAVVRSHQGVADDPARPDPPGKVPAGDQGTFGPAVGRCSSFRRDEELARPPGICSSSS